MDWLFTPNELILPILIAALVSTGVLWNCASRERGLQQKAHKKKKASKEKKGSKEAKKSREGSKEPVSLDKTADDKVSGGNLHKVPSAHGHPKTLTDPKGECHTAKEIDFLYPMDSNDRMYMDESTLRHVSSLEPDNETSLMVRSNVRTRDTDILTLN